MAWTAIGPSLCSAQAARNASASAGLMLGGRHICGELAKIWTPSQPIEAALAGMPLRPPPDTWAPRRTRAGGVSVAIEDAGSEGDMVIEDLQVGKRLWPSGHERTFAAG